MGAKEIFNSIRESSLFMVSMRATFAEYDILSKINQDLLRQERERLLVSISGNIFAKSWANYKFRTKILFDDNFWTWVDGTFQNVVARYRQRNIEFLANPLKEFANVVYRVGYIDLLLKKTKNVNKTDKKENVAIDKEFESYFSAIFHGVGNNIPYYKWLVDRMIEDKYTGKKVAQIALLCYEGGYMVNKPNTFAAWHKIFCEKCGCQYVKYANKNKLRAEMSEEFKSYWNFLKQ